MTVDDAPSMLLREMSARTLSRRRFLHSAGVIGLVAGMDALLPTYARSARGVSAPLPLQPRMVDGVAVYDLTIAETPFAVAGRRATATTINGTVPGPLLQFREGEEIILRVDNRLGDDTSIHWHGVLVPPIMDGVPGVSFPGITAGSIFEYRFPLKQNNTAPTGITATRGYRSRSAITARWSSGPRRATRTSSTVSIS